MSEIAPEGPYIFQPYGMQDEPYWTTGRIYAIGGLNLFTEIKGLTKEEANKILDVLKHK